MARTLKARALGSALRQAREEKGLLLRELASAIKRDIGVLSRWETGERTPKPELVAQILTRLDVDGDRYDEIMTLAYGTDESQWVATTLPEQRQQMAAYVDWEQNASRIVEVAPLLVPGLLQTSELRTPSPSSFRWVTTRSPPLWSLLTAEAPRSGPRGHCGGVVRGRRCVSDRRRGRPRADLVTPSPREQPAAPGQPSSTLFSAYAHPWGRRVRDRPCV